MRTLPILLPNPIITFPRPQWFVTPCRRIKILTCTPSGKMRSSMDADRVDTARGRSQEIRRSIDMFQPHFFRTSQPPTKTPFGRSSNWTFGDSNVDLFSKLPPESSWIKHGLVERQTSATRVPWQTRVMILTSNHVLFSKPGSDTAVDKISLSNISFVGARYANISFEEDRQGNKSAKIRHELTPVRSNGSITAITSMSSLISAGRKRFGQSIGGGSEEMIKGQHFTFEIVTSMDGRDRSYFCRLDSVHASDAWVASIEHSRSEHMLNGLARGTVLSRCQVLRATLMPFHRQITISYRPPFRAVVRAFNHLASQTSNTPDVPAGPTHTYSPTRAGPADSPRRRRHTDRAALSAGAGGAAGPRRGGVRQHRRAARRRARHPPRLPLLGPLPPFPPTSLPSQRLLQRAEAACTSKDPAGIRRCRALEAAGKRRGAPALGAREQRRTGYSRPRARAAGGRPP